MNGLRVALGAVASTLANTGAIALATAAAPASLPDGVTGRVRTPSGPVRVIDRVEIGVVIEIEPGLGVRPWDATYAARLREAGWTLVESVVEPPGLSPAGRVEHRAVFMVEPFLDGEYTVPPVGFEVVLPDGSALATALEGGVVTVGSVLPPGEAESFALPIGGETGGDLAGDLGASQGDKPREGDRPLGSLRTPPAEPGDFPTPIVIGGVALGLAGVSIGLPIRAAWRRRARRAIDPIEALARLSERDHGPEALDQAHRLLRSMAASRRDDGPLQDLIDRVEHARYAPARSAAASRLLVVEAAALAKRARSGSDMGRGAEA